MKTPNWQLIDELWPVDGDHSKKLVPATKAGECIQCGKCCAIIRIGADYEYFLEKSRQLLDYYGDKGEPVPDSELKWCQDSLFIVRHWIPLRRTVAVMRGFKDDIYSTDFFYTCSLLKNDKTCAAHNKYRPLVCTGYPFYNHKVRNTEVFRGCGFAKQRRKTV